MLKSFQMTIMYIISNKKKLKSKRISKIGKKELSKNEIIKKI